MQNSGLHAEWLQRLPVFKDQIGLERWSLSHQSGEGQQGAKEPGHPVWSLAAVLSRVSTRCDGCFEFVTTQDGPMQLLQDHGIAGVVGVAVREHDGKPGLA